MRKFFRRKQQNCSHSDCIHADRKVRENLTERKIDKTLEDSFPASDPPAWY